MNSKTDSDHTPSKTLKKIEGKSKKTIALQKRKRGVLKKLIELSVLCSQDIFLVVWDCERQRLVRYQSEQQFNLERVNDIFAARNGTQIESYSNCNYNLLENERILKNDIEQMKQSVDSITAPTAPSEIPCSQVSPMVENLSIQNQIMQSRNQIIERRLSEKMSEAGDQSLLPSKRSSFYQHIEQSLKCQKTQSLKQPPKVNEVYFMNDHAGGITPQPKFNVKLVDQLVQAKRQELNQYTGMNMSSNGSILKGKTLSVHSGGDSIMHFPIAQRGKSDKFDGGLDLDQNKRGNDLTQVLKWLNGMEN